MAYSSSKICARLDPFASGPFSVSAPLVTVMLQGRLPKLHPALRPFCWQSVSEQHCVTVVIVLNSGANWFCSGVKLPPMRCMTCACAAVVS